MTELADSTDAAEMIEPMSADPIDQKELAEQLLEQAKEQNIELVGPGGLLGQLTQSVLEWGFPRMPTDDARARDARRSRIFLTDKLSAALAACEAHA